MAAPETQQQKCQLRTATGASPQYDYPGFQFTAQSSPSSSALPQQHHYLTQPSCYPLDQHYQNHQLLSFHAPFLIHRLHQHSEHTGHPPPNQTTSAQSADQVHSLHPRRRVYRHTAPQSFPISKIQSYSHHSFTSTPISQFSGIRRGESPPIYQQHLLQRLLSSFPQDAYPEPPPSMSKNTNSQYSSEKLPTSNRKIASARGIKRDSHEAELEDVAYDSVTEPDTSGDEPEDDDDEYNSQSPSSRSRCMSRSSTKSTPTSEVADKESGKPYAVLVYEALMSTETRSMTVSEIYDYFKKTHPHFRNVKGRGWMNSIRYNLSMNEGFKLVQRPEGQEGKGGIWMVTSEAQKYGIKSTTRSRQSNSPRKKRYQSASYALRARSQPVIPAMVASQHYSLPKFEDDSDFDHDHDGEYPENQRPFLGSSGPITPQSPYFSLFQDSASLYHNTHPHNLHGLVRYGQSDSEPVTLKVEDGPPIPMFLPEYGDAYPSPPAHDYSGESCGLGDSDQQFLAPYDHSLFEEQFNITELMDCYGNVTPLHVTFVDC